MPTEKDTSRSASPTGSPGKPSVILLKKEPGRGWNNKIVGHGDESPDQLLANPRNFRIHPDHQQAALVGVLKEVGWVSTVMVNQRTGTVVDGHARVAVALRHHQPTVPVTYVELSPDEEALILATFDTISAQACTDKHQLAELLHEVQTGEEGIQALLDGLSAEQGLLKTLTTVEPYERTVAAPRGMTKTKLKRLLRRWAAKADDDGDSLTDALVFIDTLIDPVEAN